MRLQTSRRTPSRLTRSVQSSAGSAVRGDACHAGTARPVGVVSGMACWNSKRRTVGEAGTDHQSHAAAVKAIIDACGAHPRDGIPPVACSRRAGVSSRTNAPSPASRHRRGTVPQASRQAHAASSSDSRCKLCRHGITHERPTLVPPVFACVSMTRTRARRATRQYARNPQRVDDTDREQETDEHHLCQTTDNAIHVVASSIFGPRSSAPVSVR